MLCALATAVWGQGINSDNPNRGGPCNNDARAEATIFSLYAAFASGDADTIEAILHPDVVWVESEGIPYGGTFIGRDAVFEGVFAKIAGEWENFTAEVDEIFSAEGRRVVTLGHDSGTYVATGRSMVAPTASFWTLNGQCQVIHFQQFIDTLQVRSAIDIDLEP
jgi:ketosteroid isomerase-like protein